MSNLIILGRDNPKIQELLDQMNATVTQATSEAEFYKKKMEQLVKKTNEKKQEIWREIEAEIDAKGYLNEGEKAADLCLTIDSDVGAVKRHSCNGKGKHGRGMSGMMELSPTHPLAQILSSLFDPK